MTMQKLFSAIFAMVALAVLAVPAGAQITESAAREKAVKIARPTWIGAQINSFMW